MNEVGIVNCGLGNLRSVLNAFEHLGAGAALVTQPAELASYRRIVLPGVGAFAKGMDCLRAGGWLEALNREVREKGKPFLGICLGLHLLATRGLEHGVNEGLGWLEGSVEKLPAPRVPHVGWNSVVYDQPLRILAGIPSGADFYFTHSYALLAPPPAAAVAMSDYGRPFVSVLERENVFAAQFHPEKSQKAGLRLLGNFLKC